LSPAVQQFLNHAAHPSHRSRLPNCKRPNQVFMLSFAQEFRLAHAC